MKRFTVLSLAFSLLEWNAVSPMKPPSYVTPYERNSKDLNQCIANAWEDVRPKLAEGIPKLKIPPLEPYFLSEMITLKKTPSDPLDFNINMTQLKITGLMKMIVSKLNVDLMDLSGSVSLAFSDLNVTTLYAVDALVMKIVPLKGKGQYNGAIRDVRVNVTGKAVLSSKNEHGKSYLKITQLNLKLFIGNAIGRMKDTSKNQQSEILTETANRFYEDNRRAVLDTIITPSIEGFCQTIVLETSNRFLSVVPFEEIYSSVVCSGEP